jgi:hypothetical protein
MVAGGRNHLDAGRRSRRKSSARDVLAGVKTRRIYAIDQV